ncbi:MAG: glycosyltransferase family 4 protein [Pseudomonadota bacterium]
MRAVFAIPGDIATPTGGYGYARRLVRGAPAAGLDLEVLSLPSGFPDPDIADLVTTRAALSEVPSDTPLLIDGLAYGALPADIIATIRAPIVALCHHPLALETGVSAEDAKRLHRTETDALAAAKAVVVTSHATSDIVTSDYGVSAQRLTVAPPGTDPAPRAPGTTGCRIVSVGSVTPRKGHDRLVNALTRCADQEWTLRIIGPHPDPSCLADLQVKIGEAGLGDRIKLTGPQSMPAVTAAYQAADLFVLASEYEGFGMAFAEAMANGLPVLGLHCDAVAEATLGAAELVTPDQFDETLARLIGDTDLRSALADRCWDAAANLPRWPDTVAKIASVLRRLT